MKTYDAINITSQITECETMLRSIQIMIITFGRNRQSQFQSTFSIRINWSDLAMFIHLLVTQLIINAAEVGSSHLIILPSQEFVDHLWPILERQLFCTQRVEACYLRRFRSTSWVVVTAESLNRDYESVPILIFFQKRQHEAFGGHEAVLGIYEFWR